MVNPVVCAFLNNTLFEKDTTLSGTGEVKFQIGNDNIVRNNIIVANSQNLFVTNPFAPSDSFNNAFDFNLYMGPDGIEAGEWTWQDQEYIGFGNYRDGTEQDSGSLYADPSFVDSGGFDFHLQSGSPAIDAGDPSFMSADGELDVHSMTRILGVRVDIGATAGTSATPSPTPTPPPTSGGLNAALTWQPPD